MFTPSLTLMPDNLRKSQSSESVTLSRIMKEAGTTNNSVALDCLIQLTRPLWSQCPEEFHSDQHKIRYLLFALFDYLCAKREISQIMSSNYSYNWFIFAPREQLHVDNLESSEAPVKGTSLDCELFQKCGKRPRKYRLPRYDRRYTNERNKTDRHRSNKNPISRNRKPRLCHICRSNGHFSSYHRTKNMKQYVIG